MVTETVTKVTSHGDASKAETRVTSHCDLCGKFIELLGVHPDADIGDRDVGQTLYVRLNDDPYEKLELCKPHFESFLEVYRMFKESTFTAY